MSILKVAVAVRKRRYGVLQFLADYRLILRCALCYSKKCDLIKNETFMDATDVDRSSFARLSIIGDDRTPTCKTMMPIQELIIFAAFTGSLNVLETSMGENFQLQVFETARKTLWKCASLTAITGNDMRERMHHYECHRNIGSLLPSDNLNMRIAASFGSSCRVLAASFIELLEDDFEMIKWRKIGDGDNKIYGMNFCLRTEAERFYQMLRLHSSSGSVSYALPRKLVFQKNFFHTNNRCISSKYIPQITICSSGDGGGRAKSIEISGPLNFEHKIHIGLDSVHGYEDNDFLKKILRETQLLFGSRETLIANERRLHIRKQSRTTLSCVKHFDQVKRNNRKSTNFGDKLLEITQSSNMQQTVTISGEGYSDPPNNLNGSNRMNLQTTEEMDHPETPRKCYDRKQKLTTCTVDHGERFISSKSSATMIRKDFERR
ncbi:unnamed protein product [Acanthocheilonema viteae]|uniref:CRIB domain-containing protein n=1 Tax=Acanthocheilonema viteae TaxID=6277 RepID=A0A498S9L9_ACAVI|nr:unnamed protein product [Acanthocheilonema viteae]